MRILLASLHPRSFSGQIHSLHALERVLTASGADVTVRTAASDDRSRATGKPGFASYVTTTLGLLRAIVREQQRYDLVHVYLPTPAFTLLSDWLRVQLRIPLLVGYDAPYIPESLLLAVVRDARADPGFYGPLLASNNAFLARSARYSATGYVVSSQYQRNQLRDLGVSAPVVAVPNVVDVPDVAGPPSVDVATARRAIGLPEAGPLIGYIGHFHPVKGVETLVDAFAMLRRRQPAARLVLAWSGLGDRQPIDRRIARLGYEAETIWLGPTCLTHFLRSVDALALPYKYPIGQNAYPNLLLEAQAVGVPLATTRIPIAAETCQDGETALLVPPGSPAALAEALERLVADGDLAADMRVRQRQHFARRFSPEVLGRRYESLYRAALGATARRAVPVGQLGQLVRVR